MSEPRSWQELLNFLTSKARDDGVIKELMSFSCQEDVVKICLREEFYRKKLLAWINTSVNVSTGKSSVKASKYRELGNEKFLCKDDSGSLRLYSESIRFAPDYTEVLSLALANRSATLFHMQCFEECLEDIELALQKGYPLHLHYKLYKRRTQCYLQMKNYIEAVNNAEFAQKSLKHVKDEGKKSLLEKDLHQVYYDALLQLSAAEECKDFTPWSTHERPSLSHERPSLSHGDSQKFAYASAALDLRISEEKGRHVIANKNIKMGDILFVEKPYAFVLLPDYYGKHCHHCVKESRVMKPCNVCTEALYCSETCRKKSWMEYHQWECHGGLELFHSIGIAHLGLRMVLKAGSLHKIRKCISNSSDPEIYGNREDNYRAVYDLMPHLEDLLPEDRFQYGLTAALLTLYLCHHSDYFQQNTDHSPRVSNVNNGSKLIDDCHNTKEVLFVGGLILRHIAQLVCNGHAITKLDTTSDEYENGVVAEDQVRIATAIYPSASMMNHSCDPSIINSFYDQFLVVRAYKDISKEEEVYNCYGPHYSRMSRQERLESLKSQYFFTCTCNHCSRPEEGSIQDCFSAFWCSTCEIPLVKRPNKENASPESDEVICRCCGNTQCYSDLIDKERKADHLYNEGCTLLEKGSVMEALKNFKSCLNMRKKCLHKKNKDVLACQDKLAKCYAMLGRYRKSISLLLKTLPGVKKQFGSHSVELGNELQKVTDLMVCDLKETATNSDDFEKKFKRAIDYVKKGKEILELHYGSGHSGVQDLIEKERWLQSVQNK